MRAIVTEHVVRTPAHAPSPRRRAAFDDKGLEGPRARLVAQVAAGAWEVTDAHVDAVLRDGVAEDEVFELAVCAAIGKAERQITEALRCLDEATTTGEGS